MAKATAASSSKMWLTIYFFILSFEKITALSQQELFVSTDASPLLDTAVYSLSTQAASIDGGEKTSMNILTYATPVSITPERHWAIGLFKGTVSHENFVANRRGVLQLLAPEHAPLVRCLGGSSGRDVDKRKICKDLGFPWISMDGDDDGDQTQLCRLPGCLHYLTLECVELWDAGNHDVAICRVVKMETLKGTDSAKKEHLSTGILREKGIITEQGRVAE